MAPDLVQEAITQIKVTDLQIAEDNIRGEIFDVSELAASIKSQGVLEPLLVTDQNVVVCGARRLTAAIQAGLKTVPAIKRPFTEQERLTAMLVENLQRDDLTPMEEARAFERLRGMGLTMRQIGSQVGCGHERVSRRLALVKLPEDAQKAVEEGKIDLRDAIDIAKVVTIADTPTIKKLVTKAARGSRVNYDVDEVQNAAEAKKKVAAKVKELKKAGEPLIEVELKGYAIKTPAGTKQVLEQLGYNVDAVVMNQAEHAKLPCHAIAVHPRRETTILEMCTDPGSHPDPQKEAEEASAKRAAKAAKEQAEQAERETRQYEFLKTVAKKPTKELVLEACYISLTEDAYSWTQGSVALDLLFESKIEDENFDSGLEQEKLAETPAGKLQVTFAYAVDRMHGTEIGWDAILELAGWEDEPTEQKALPPAPEKEKPESEEAA